MAAKTPTATPQTFRSPTAVLIWVVWLLFAVGNWVDLAVQGRDHLSAVAAALLLLATGVAYVTAQRPRIIADGAGLTVRNPLRDHRIGWAAVVEADLADLVRVHCAWDGRSKVISAWAVHYSRRRQLAAEARARRAASPRRAPFGPYRPVTPADSAAEADAEKVVRLLNERAQGGTGGAAEPPASTWSGRAIAALVVPALIALVVSLI